MCMAIKVGTKPVVLEEDLVVYKVIYKDGRSKFTYFLYTPEVVNKTKFTFTPFWELFDETESKDVQKYMAEVKEDIESSSSYIIFVRDGFHSALTKERLSGRVMYHFNEVLGEFLIPKGSEVYYGFSDLVVSNQIIFKSIVDED